MQIEITGDALTAESDLTVVIGRAKTAVRTLSEASATYRDYIDAEFLGARDAKSCSVRDAANKPVATVSYNGRVWTI